MKTTHFGYIDVYLHLSLKLQLVPSMKQSLENPQCLKFLRICSTLVTFNVYSP